jgi:hypothetical protein
MDTNEELRDATTALTVEVHTLSERLSAKEILHKRTRRLTIISLVLALIVAAGGVVIVRTVICLAEWGDANSQRNDAINEAIEFEAFQEGKRDQALDVLVNNRNVDTATTAQAVKDWNTADDDTKTAKQATAQARLDYPPPLLRDYCGWFSAGSPPDPKARGTNVPAPSPTGQAPQPQ